MRKQPRFVEHPPPLELERPTTGTANRQPQGDGRPHAGYGHFFYQPAEALFHNVLGLRRAFEERRLLFLTLTTPNPGLPYPEIRRRVRQFFSNYVARNPQVTAWIRIMGRSTRGLHWHCILVLPEQISSPDLSDLREVLQNGAKGIGLIQLREVRHLGASARYLADHVEKNLRAKSSLRKKKQDIFEVLKLRLYDHSRSFPKTVQPRAKSIHPWSMAYREAAQALWTACDRKGKPSARWLYKNCELIIDQIPAILAKLGRRPVLQILAPSAACPAEPNLRPWWVPSTSKNSREPHEPLAIWDVWRLDEAEIREGGPAYYIQRPGASRDANNERAIYLTQKEFKRLVRIQPRTGNLADWISPCINI